MDNFELKQILTEWNLFLLCQHIRRAAGKMDTPASQLDEEEHIERAQQDCFHSEEVAGEHLGSVVVEECSPG